MKSKATVFFILLKNITDKSGKSPVRMVVYNGSKRKRYGIGLSLSEDDWKKINESKQKATRIKEIRTGLDGIRLKAESVINKLNPFSFEAFQSKFSETENTEQNIEGIPCLKSLFDDYITELKENDQVGTYKSYQTTINSIENFRHGILLTDLTSKFLQSYEKNLTSKGNSPATVGIYMRQLRAIVNRAIKAGYMNDKDYPFGEYNIPAARNIKQALSEDDLSKLFNYKTDDPRKRKALDFWIFSYLCNGMNFTDIAHLKKENISENYMQFIRQKTKRTKKKDLTPIRVGLHPTAKEIIEKYGNRSESNPYLFPILEPNISALTVKSRCQRIIKWVNKKMKLIQAELEISQTINTYSARHSFSTFLKLKGVSTSYIKEALGHSSEATTESYLASFTDDVKLENANLLTDFKNKLDSKDLIEIQVSPSPEPTD